MFDNFLQYTLKMFLILMYKYRNIMDKNFCYCMKIKFDKNHQNFANDFSIYVNKTFLDSKSIQKLYKVSIYS